MAVNSSSITWHNLNVVCVGGDVQAVPRGEGERAHVHLPPETQGHAGGSYLQTPLLLHW